MLKRTGLIFCALIFVVSLQDFQLIKGRRLGLKSPTTETTRTSTGATIGDRTGPLASLYAGWYLPSTTGSSSMHVGRLLMKSKSMEGTGNRILVGALIVDQDHQAIPGAEVSVEWTLPGGRTRNQQGSTHSNGVALFLVKSPLPGEHQVCVTDVIAEGYTYDPSQNHETCASLSLTLEKYAVIAHRQDCPNSNTGGVHFQGSVAFDIFGGGVFSNACLMALGDPDVHVLDGGIYYLTFYSASGNPTISPNPIQVNFPIPIPTLGISEPDYSGLPNYGDHQGGGVVYPGFYENVNVFTGTLVMQPGVYCLNEDFIVDGGVVTGNGVTLSVAGAADISPSSQVDLRAPLSVSEPSEGVEDLLFFLSGPASVASLMGYAGSIYQGTVYAPGSESLIEVGGTGSVLEAYQTQLIASTIFMLGNAEFDIVFDPDHGYPKDPP